MTAFKKVAIPHVLKIIIGFVTYELIQLFKWFLLAVPLKKLKWWRESGPHLDDSSTTSSFNFLFLSTSLVCAVFKWEWCIHGYLLPWVLTSTCQILTGRYYRFQSHQPSTTENIFECLLWQSWSLLTCSVEKMSSSQGRNIRDKERHL